MGVRNQLSALFYLCFSGRGEIYVGEVIKRRSDLRRRTELHLFAADRKRVGLTIRQFVETIVAELIGDCRARCAVETKVKNKIEMNKKYNLCRILVLNSFNFFRRFNELLTAFFRQRENL